MSFRKHVLASAVASFCVASQAMAAPPECTAQTQVDVTKIEPQVILVGEAHGTNELPRYTGELVCSLLKAGKSVVLAVEQDGDEQDALNRYMRSAGTANDRKILLKSRTWGTYSDGRGSAAMFELVESIRTLRQTGQRVGVLAFRRADNLEVPMEEPDKVRLTPADNALQNRLSDVDMANSIMYAAILYRRYVVVVLAGYSHTSTVPYTSNDPNFMSYLPMGQVVAGQMPVFTIGIDSGGGEFWTAGPGGGRQRPIQAGNLFVAGTKIDAAVHIDGLTPSPPARIPVPAAK